MIPQENRFSKKNFEFFRRKMKTFRAGNFLFFYRLGVNAPDRFAAVVSKKTGLNAVERNKFRRKSYAFFQKYLLNQNFRSHVILLFQKPAEIQDQELESAIKKLQKFLASGGQKPQNKFRKFDKGRK